jgi:hypothetical protein
MKKNEPWMQTYRGHKFYPGHVSKLRVDIGDIAHALSIMNRYGGHTREPYSVAQHCCLVHDHLPLEHRREGLLHDATEAYLVDLPKPVKLFLPEYQKLEERLAKHLGAYFGFPAVMTPAVHMADMQALITERRDLMDNLRRMDWGYLGIVPWPDTVVPWDWQVAKLNFLERYRNLKPKAKR